MEKDKLNAISQHVFGKEFGRVSKTDYCEAIGRMLQGLQEYQGVLYMRDLLYNPCHESERLNRVG
jgi:hypothetical protein